MVYLIATIVYWLIVGSLTSSGKYFMQIHYESEFNIIYTNTNIEEGMIRYDLSNWKSMGS